MIQRVSEESWTSEGVLRDRQKELYGGRRKVLDAHLVHETTFFFLVGVEDR
jgi:hypothetical protein